MPARVSRAGLHRIHVLPEPFTRAAEAKFALESVGMSDEPATAPPRRTHRTRPWLAGLVLLGCVAFGWWWRTSYFKGPDKITLYSIDGRVAPVAEVAQTDQHFHGYPVFGKIDITSAEDIREILTAVDAGMANCDVERAACFWPRHAIQMVQRGMLVEYVICFECNTIAICRDGQSEFVAINSDPQPLLNRKLQEAGIPIAPPTARK